MGLLCYESFYIAHKVFLIRKDGKNMKVFLGGTVDGKDWRRYVMEELDKRGIDYFNPVVEDYTEEAQKIEDMEKENADAWLFVITNDMAGVFSISEAAEYAVRKGQRVVFCNMYTRKETDAEIRMGGSLAHVERQLGKYTGNICHDLDMAVVGLELVQMDIEDDEADNALVDEKERG